MKLKWFKYLYIYIKMSTESTSDTATQNYTGGLLTLELVKKYSSLISLKDSDPETDLSLFCYNKCNQNSENIVKNCRGVVFQGDNLVMQAFPFTQEFSENDRELITDALEPVFSQCLFFDSEEGACIRMFAVKIPGTDQVKWYTTTNRKLDAFKSKWASRESFGDGFIKALEEEVKYSPQLADAVGEHTTGRPLLDAFQRNCLNPNTQYMFLVRHTEENRIVCDAPENPRVFHVGSFRDGNLFFEPICIPMPKQHKFSCVSEMLDFVGKINFRFHQGIIVFAPGNRQYKIFQSNYHELFNARGNERSIKFRYLQVRNDRAKVRALRYLYPRVEESFDLYEKTLDEITEHIYTSYVNRFIKKEYITVPTEEFAVMKECHSWHEYDRAKNRISREKVYEVLSRQQPTSLNAMIHRFLMGGAEPTEKPEKTRGPQTGFGNRSSLIIRERKNRQEKPE